MVDLLPPSPPARCRLTVFLTSEHLAEIRRLARERGERPGRVASVIVESFLKARVGERDVGGGPPEEVGAGGA